MRGERFCMSLATLVALTAVLLGGLGLWAADEVPLVVNVGQLVDDIFLSSYDPFHDKNDTLHRRYQRQFQQYRPHGVWEEPVQSSITAEFYQDRPIHFIPNLPEMFSSRHVLTIGSARFTFLTDRIVRMEWELDGQFVDAPSIVFAERDQFLAQSTSAPFVHVWEEAHVPAGHIICMQTRSVLVRYGNLENIRDGEYLNYIASPPFNKQTVQVTVRQTGSIWEPGKKDKRNLRGTTTTLDHTNSSVPLERGLLSRSGWSFIDDSYSPLLRNGTPSGHMDFAFAEERVTTRNQTDWYILGCGHQYRRCLGEYVQIAGRVPLPPRYAFGVWWSRWWSYTDNELKTLINEFDHFAVPLDNLVIDMDWHLTAYPAMNQGALDQAGEPLGWTGYTWNSQYFPDPAGFLSWCHEQGLHVTLNLHPAAGIQPHEEKYEAAARALDIDPASRQYISFNITNERFVDTYFKYIIEPLEDQGIDFWWIDYKEAPVTDILHLNPVIWLNHLFFNHMEELPVRDVFKPADENEENTYEPSTATNRRQRGLIFHRWGGLGSHRYQVGFSGDTYSAWSTLHFQVYFTHTACNVAFAYWSHDIGGFMSDGPTDPELFVRWVQWGALSPVFRTHAWRQDYLERRIWRYPTLEFLAMREAIYLRYSLVPYLYTMARETYETGVGLFYPLYYDHPESEAAYQHKTQGMVGPSILFAPVTTPRSASNWLALKNIYLPNYGKEVEANHPTDEEEHGARLEWIEWSTLTSLPPQVHDRWFALDDIPIYLKEGTILPMSPVASKASNTGLLNMHTIEPHEPVLLTIFPGPHATSGAFTLYEDDGISSEYQKNNSRSFVTTQFDSALDSSAMQWNVRIAASQGSYPEMQPTRSYLIRMVGMPPPAQVTVNGEIVPAHREYRTSSLGDEFYYWSSSRSSDDWKTSIPHLLNDTRDHSYWYYDALRMSLIIRTVEYPREEEKHVQIDLQERSRSSLKKSLGLIHNGAVGLVRKVRRVTQLAEENWRAAREILSMPNTVESDLQWPTWKRAYEKIPGLVDEFIQQIRESDRTSSHEDAKKTILLQHLLHSLDEEFA